MMPSINRKSSGQVMLLVVLSLSATVLTITALSGLLGVYQIRQAYNIGNSIRAFYGAETGAELELYRWFRDRSDCYDPGPIWTPSDRNCIPVPVLSNGVGIFTLADPVAVRDVMIASGRAGGQLGSGRSLFFVRDPLDPSRILREER